MIKDIYVVDVRRVNEVDFLKRLGRVLRRVDYLRRSDVLKRLGKVLMKVMDGKELIDCKG
jgi:hypothetical protein